MSPPARKIRRILFICSGNCVRSQMAEALLNYRGAGRFLAFSAGASPAGFVHPGAVSVLQEIRVPARALRSKGWAEFANQPFDAVITLCDSARERLCARWPEPHPTNEPPPFPIRVHWPFTDPTRDEPHMPDSTQDAFRLVRDQIRESIERLAVAPPEILEDDLAFARLLRQSAPPTEEDEPEEDHP